MPSPIRGVIPAMLTPRRAGSNEVDRARLVELVEFLNDRGVDAITLFGSTGEFTHFTPEERGRAAAMAVKRSRAPVLVNASHSTLDGAIGIAREAMEAGAAGVLVMPPYYFRYSQESIRAFMLAFAARAGAPVYLYNIPPFTTPMAIETMVELLESGAFAGIKDSGGRWEDFVKLQATGFAVITGADAMFSRAARAGAAGVISGVASVVPELMVSIGRAVGANEDTAKLDARVTAFLERVMKFPFPVALRAALAIRGIDAGPHASPPGAEESKSLDEFRGWFREFLQDLAG
jgi:dihydrodipicolinate synthase/N-acetylneuraminate lyase